MNRIQGKDRRIETYEFKKISLSCFNDKIYIQNNGMMDKVLVIKANYEKTVMLVTIQKSFLSSYKKIVLILSLIRTFF